MSRRKKLKEYRSKTIDEGSVEFTNGENVKQFFFECERGLQEMLATFVASMEAGGWQLNSVTKRKYRKKVRVDGPSIYGVQSSILNILD